MKVSEMMVRDVKKCLAVDTLDVAARIMWENDCGVVPVIDAVGHLVGMITDRDACMTAYTKGRVLQAIRVGEAMAEVIVTCSPDEPVDAAMSRMRSAKVRRLPVLDAEKRLIGILSLNDLARAAERQPRASEHQRFREEVVRTLAAICEPRRKLDAATRPSVIGSRRNGSVGIAARQVDLEC